MSNETTYTANYNKKAQEELRKKQEEAQRRADEERRQRIERQKREKIKEAITNAKKVFNKVDAKKIDKFATDDYQTAMDNLSLAEREFQSGNLDKSLQLAKIALQELRLAEEIASEKEEQWAKAKVVAISTIDELKSDYAASETELICRWVQKEYKQLEKILREADGHLQEGKFQKITELAVRYKEAILEMRRKANDLEEKEIERLFLAEKILTVLKEMNFECQAGLSQPDMPSSEVIIIAHTPFGKQISFNIELSGKLKANYSGYPENVGTEENQWFCVQDAKMIEQLLKERFGVDLNPTSHRIMKRPSPIIGGSAKSLPITRHYGTQR